MLLAPGLPTSTGHRLSMAKAPPARYIAGNLEGIRLDEEPGLKPGRAASSWGFESLAFRFFLDN